MQVHRSRIWSILLAGLLAVAMLSTTHGPVAAQSSDMAIRTFTYGDVVEIAPQVQLVVGRPLDIQKGQVDIANALVYKTKETLVIIDTGGTAEFIQHLQTAVDRLKPFAKILLISSHGHADHVGNNAWVDTLGAPVTHVISSHDLEAMRDQVGYFTRGFDEAAPYISGGPPSAAFAQQIVDMFGGLDTETRNLTTLESLPLVPITIGETSWEGWRLLDGDVLVMRTSGHTAGQVVVFLPEPRIFHLSDETTGFYQVFPDASPASNLLTLQRAARAVESGAVAAVTDGHTFTVRSGKAAVAYLDGFVDAAYAFDAAVTRIINENPGGITIPELEKQVAAAPELANVPGGANDIPVFSFMKITNKLRELGIKNPADPSARIAFPK